MLIATAYLVFLRADGRCRRCASQAEEGRWQDHPRAQDRHDQAGGGEEGEESAEAPVSETFEDLDTQLDLLELVHLADVYHHGLYVDFGTAAQAKYSVGDWRAAGWGARSSEGDTTFTLVVAGIGVAIVHGCKPIRLWTGAKPYHGWVGGHRGRREDRALSHLAPCTPGWERPARNDQCLPHPVPSGSPPLP